ncbi:WD40-repeat-containing domain protein, partial [Rhodocollybia butyracea]
YIISGSLDRTVRIWDTQSGTESQKLEGHTDGIKSVALSPQGQQLVSGSSDKTVQIWDTHCFGKLEMLGTHTAGVISVVSLDHHTVGAQDGQPHSQMPLQNYPHIPVTPAMHLPYEFPKHELPWCVGQNLWLVSPIDFAPLLRLPRHLHPGLYTPSTSQIISNNGATKLGLGKETHCHKGCIGYGKTVQISYILKWLKSFGPRW